MRPFYKSIICYLGLGMLGRPARRLSYYILDFILDRVFFILRACRLLEPVKEFDKKQVEKILIIRLDRIGDLILSTPAIRAVREGFAGREIHLLVSSYTKDLVVNNPDIDRLLVGGKDKIKKEYELAIALHPGLKQNYIAFKSGAKFRLGYDGWGGGFFLTRRLKYDRAVRVRHEVITALEAVGTIGCETEDKSLEISITDEGERFAEGFFRDNEISRDALVIAVHPGARQAYLRWKKEGFVELSDRLAKEKSAEIILLGSEKERELVEAIASSMTKKLILAIGLSLTRLISLIKRCRLFIGNSTGPMHIASALKVPVVAIFGPIHPYDSYKAWGPWGDRHIIVSKNLDCPHCHPTDCRTFECMKLISANDVLEAAEKLL